MTKYAMKQPNDIIELNKQAGNFMSSLFVGMKGIIIRTYTCDYDFKDCVNENGLEYANQCDCHYRAEVKLLDYPNVYVKDLVFSEMDIVDLK